jgi:DNA polymerase-3 subunit alpha
MGKKKPEEMAQQRSIFVSGATERGVPEPLATHIFDLMEKFAGYGFNKSHSAAYAVLTYQTAWLKAHYPAAFLAAVLSSDMDKTDKVVVGIDDSKVMGIEVLPPDVNASDYRFTVTADGGVRYGLGAIKGVGQSAVEAIVAARTEGGEFRDLSDFCQRVELGKLNRRCLEALLKAGSFDRIGANRATLMAELPAALALGDQSSRADTTGQVDLFGLGAAAPARAAATTVVHPEWPPSIRLAGERETLGFFMTGHPLDEYAHDRSYIAPGTIAELAGPRPAGGEGKWVPPRQVTVAGLVLEIKKRGTRTTMTLDDGSGRMEVALFDEILQQHRELIVKDALLVVEGALKWNDFAEGWQLSAKRIQSLDAAREAQARRVLVRLPAGADPAGLVKRLEGLLGPARGGRCPVALYLSGTAGQGLVELGPEWAVKPTRALLGELAQHFGEAQVRLIYHPRDQDAALREWEMAGRGDAPTLKMAG